MALILPTTTTADQTFADESSRRRSTFYVPLSTEDLSFNNNDDDNDGGGVKKSPVVNLSTYDWSIDDSIDGSEILRDKSSNLLSTDDSNRLKRYGIVLNGSVNIDDSNLEVHANHKRSKTKNITSSTPIKDAPKDIKNTSHHHKETVKEKSKTLPAKDSVLSSPSIFPPKNSHMLKSTPKMSINNCSSLSDTSVLLPHTPMTNATPKKSLSFIRRTHSTKLSRNNSLLKSLTSKCVVENSNENFPVNVYDLSIERLELYLKAENCDDLVRELFLREPLNTSSSDNGSEKNKENNFYKYDEDAMSGKK